MSSKRALTGFRVPGEGAAENRAWEVARLAYANRVPARRRRSRTRPLIALAVVAAACALTLSPAGARVGTLIKRALGLPHPAPAVFSLPARGRVLLSGPGGTWTVAADGSTRRVGPWAHASWSPFGLNLTVFGPNQLAAVDPRGTLRWALARPAVGDPRWYPPTGYRVAYRSGADLRVVAGDGIGDHLLATGVAPMAPAWRPGHPYELAYVDSAGRVVIRDADTGQELWTASAGARVDRVAWSDTGDRLVAVAGSEVRVFAPSSASITRIALSPGLHPADTALSPDGRMLALVLGGSAGGVVIEPLDGPRPTPRRVLAGVGLQQVAWSPDGKWLLASWPAADQWVFIRVTGAPRISAVSRISQQFSTGAGRGFPQLDGWCCTAQGKAH